jgi:putative membrane protein
MTFVIRLLVNAAALFVATAIVPGVTYAGGWLPFLGVALIFGVVNAFIRPVAKILAFPLIILTLGIFSFVVNALMLWLTSALSGTLALGFHVRGFWAAFVGALVVSAVSMVLSLVVNERPVRSVDQRRFSAARSEDFDPDAGRG